MKYRLTFKQVDGTWGMSNGYDIKKVPKELYGALYKLMKYEESNFQPEEIELLKNMYNCAVQRFEECDWVPCSERLPEQSGQYIVTLAGADEVKICEYFANMKAWDILKHGIEEGETREVLAWKPNPKIWQPD